MTSRSRVTGTSKAELQKLSKTGLYEWAEQMVPRRSKMSREQLISSLPGPRHRRSKSPA
ncbi:hypothetical protein PV735_47340 [Streptomyces turgidiscabies]|uniref:Uncharacterized protein n=1 Tax=Streptomyces turgidiscabies (strain Car8) TaxID=698760 RepID=L7F404_STRT8|nr:hypothetical protein [Streptomyces turgidiscabies]ELP65731.1 hypothetical protein STRTUCAR8_10223 [Streptomyces turgidiscabies Car8]MDX3500233.1 hypothetical protein [Streptomyces turgidiscabies]